MTTQEWIQKAQTHRDKLVSLLENYHPGSFSKPPDVRITAPAAEAACERVRSTIRRNEFQESKFPAQRFDDALEAKNFRVAYSLLNSAWFGVPESTECWAITGFREAVELLDNPPEDEERTITNEQS